MKWLFTVFFAIASAFLHPAIGTAQAPLPPGIPDYNFSSTIDAAPGMLFLTPNFIGTSSASPALYLIDESGSLVFYKQLDPTGPPFQPQFVGDFKLHHDGRLSFARLNSGGMATTFFLDSTFSLIDSAGCSGGAVFDTHDFIVTQDGHYHYFCKRDTMMDLSQIVTSNGNQGASWGTVEYEILEESDNAGNVIFQWNPMNHISITDVNSNYFNDTAFLDFTHYNSIDIDSNGNYLLSSRHCEDITYVDKTSGNIIWRFGGNANQFTLTNDTVLFSGQHTAHFLGNGRIGLFDNATVPQSGIARAIEYQLDTTTMEATVTWSRLNGMGLRSLAMGSNQNLPNGNHLIDWGLMPPLTTSITLIEVRNPGPPVMQLDLQGNFFSYRAYKYELPWGLNRPVVTCNPITHSLDAEPGFQNYYWSNGDSGITMAIQDTGWFQVWVDAGIGRISSEAFHVTDLLNPCNIIQDIPSSNSGVSVYPNPAKDHLVIINQGEELILNAALFNFSGQKLAHWEIDSAADRKELNLPEIPKGVYYLRIEFGPGVQTKKIILQ